MSSKPTAEESSALGYQTNGNDSEKSTNTQADTPEALPQELIEQLTAWFQHSLAAGGELADLFHLELHLALSDARRLLLVWVTLVPFVMLSWLSSAVLASWLVYEVSSSAVFGLATFTLLQLLVTIFLFILRSRYRKQLGFHRTKKHLKRLMQGAKDEPTNTAQKDG